MNTCDGLSSFFGRVFWRFQAGQRFYQRYYINETKSRNSLSCSHVHLVHVFAYIHVFMCIFRKRFIYMTYPKFKLNKKPTRFPEVKNIHNYCMDINNRMELIMESKVHCTYSGQKPHSQVETVLKSLFMNTSPAVCCSQLQDAFCPLWCRSRIAQYLCWLICSDAHGQNEPWRIKVDVSFE